MHLIVSKVVILSSLTRSTGNRTTALRIAEHFTSDVLASEVASRCVEHLQVQLVDESDDATLVATALQPPCNSSNNEQQCNRKAVDDTTNQYTQYITFVIAIHAYRAGRHLLDTEHIRYAIVFGGTDVNEQQYQLDQHKMHVMSHAVARASRLVAFHQAVHQAASNVW
jgi:hypothetical protein